MNVPRRALEQGYISVPKQELGNEMNDKERGLILAFAGMTLVF
jgi:hypothetical protein